MITGKCKNRETGSGQGSGRPTAGTGAVSGRADVGIGPYGCARSKETEAGSERADVGIGPYGMDVFGIL